MHPPHYNRLKSIPFYGWKVFHCIYEEVLHTFICWWTSRLLPCPGYCKQCCNEHWVYVSFSIMVFSGYMPSSGIARSYRSFIPSFFSEVSKLFSIIVASIYIPTNNARHWPFIHILFIIYCLLIFLMIILTGGRWYNIILLICIFNNKWCWAFFTCLLAISMSNLEKCLFRFSANF